MIGHRVVLRPRSLLESGDLAFALVRRHWRDFLKLLPWTAVPALIGWAAQVFLSQPAWAGWTIAALGSSLFGGIAVLLCGELMLTPTVSHAQLRRRFLRDLPRWVVARVVGWFITFVTFGFGYGRAAFLPEAVLLERGQTGAAMSRSSALLRATPGRFLGLSSVTLLAWGFAATGGQATAEGIVSLFGFAPKDGPSIFAYLAFAAMSLYLSALRFLLYIDCRTRREGWDLQVQMSALVAAAQKRTAIDEASGEAA